MSSQAMNAAAERFASQGIGSIFLYTNEAHPGENYPHHRSMEQKFKHAQALRDIYAVTRPILVDALDGACHRRYGGYPNMTWIINPSGTIMYKANWTSSASVVNTLDYLLNIPERRKQGERLSPFLVERVEYRQQDYSAFYGALRRNGQQAVDDFITEFPASAKYAEEDDKLKTES
jgi:hypothetical protein